MTKRFLPYFSSVLLVHILIIFGLSMTYLSMQSPAGSGPTSFKVRVAQAFQSLVPKRARSNPASKSNQALKPLASAEQENQPQEASTTGSGQADLRSMYYAEIRAKIEAHKSYPVISRRLGQTGLVTVGFTLLEDGSIINIHVASASPFERLNESAVDAVRKAGKMNPIPRDLGETKIDIKVPVKFTDI